MKIKSDNGTVTFIMRAGKDFVRNQMPVATADAILKNGSDIEVTDKRGEGSEICVDDTYFFPCEVEVEKPVKKNGRK